MALLPPVDWDQIATKKDLEVLEARFTAQTEREFRNVYRAINRQSVAMVIALAASPVFAALAERYIPPLG